jgi:pyruvate formate lyase activating enzyme
MQIYIGGIVPLSTVDWKKNVSLVIFFAGCDFRCPYCQNPDFVDFKSQHLLELRSVKDEIRKNAAFIDGIVFSGGEACLQRQALLAIARYAKELNLKVAVETNGSKPEAIQSLLHENLLDFVAIDFKAPLDEKTFEKVTKSQTYFKGTGQVIEGFQKTLKILRDNEDTLDIEFRTTIVPGIIDSKEDLCEIAREMSDINAIWVLQQFRNEQKVLEPRLQHIDTPSRQSIEQLREEILKKFPGMRIEVKAN